ncbi:MAG TPA: TVP38/TMEM64 family protein [Alphaproteobacteria bacterium]
MRWLPLLALALGCATFFVLGLHRYVSFDMLARHRGELAAWVAAHPLLAPLTYILVYIAIVAFSLPGGAVLTITGGFLFGTVFGAFYAVLGATVGAMVVFVAARTALGDVLRARAGGAIKQMEEGFRRNALSYLLVLRLVPVFPFFLVNLVPAFLGVPLRTFFLATFIGIIPGALVYASVGNGLGAVLEAGEAPDAGIIFRPAILLPILGLAALALVPVLYKQRRGK